MTDIITVTGNVATDPEQRSVADGVSVTSFRLASTHRRFDRSSNAWVDSYTNYYTVSAFRSLGTNALASLRRGERVVVSGRLRIRDWDNGTRKGTTAEIDAESVGHDLLFGSTVFHKGGAPAAVDGHREAAESAAGGPVLGADADVAAAVDQDGWGIPAAIPERESAGVPF
jgi:single-strand DNA-binding protein